jgi:ATP-binding cassette subfamily B protein
MPVSSKNKIQFWNIAYTKPAMFYVVWILVLQTINFLSYFILFKFTKSANTTLSFFENYYFIAALVFFFLAFFLEKKFISFVLKITSPYLSQLQSQLWDFFYLLDYSSFIKKERIYFFDIYIVHLWQFREALLTLLLELIPSALLVFTLLFVVFLINIQISLFIIIGFIFLGIVQFGQLRPLNRIMQKFKTAWRNYSFYIGRWIDQFELYKFNRGIKQSKLEKNEKFENFLSTGNDLYKKRSDKISDQIFLNNLMKLFIILLSFVYANKNSIQTIDFIVIIFLLGILQTNINKLSSGFISIFNGWNSIQVLKEVEEWKLENNLKYSGEISSLQFKQIEYHYKSDLRIGPQNFYFIKGKIYLIKGENGVGKSTFIKIFAGLLSPKSGHIYVNEKEIMPEIWINYRSTIGIVHQTSKLFYGTIKDNLILHENSFDTSNILKKYLISKTDDVLIGESGELLSGGQIQKLKIIRELIQSKELLILDEPLNNLDINSIEVICNEIKDFKKDRITIIVCHTDYFDNIADEILVLK